MYSVISLENWTAISTVESDLSSEVPYICGYMTFPRAAQQVDRTDFDHRILLFRWWIRGGIYSFFFCCLFVSTTIYWSFFYLSPIDFKKVHLRKENRGDLIARWVIRDDMIPSFSFIYEGYIGGGVNLGLLWWKGCNWWTSVSSGWQSAWKKCHDLFGFITNKLCYVYRTTKIGEMNREDCNSFFYRRWSTA